MKPHTEETAPEATDWGAGRRETVDVPMNPHMFRERLRELATRHLDSVRRICNRYVQNPHDADDLTQEVLVKAARAWCARPGPEPPAGWLHRVVVNHCNDHLRRRRRQEALLGRYLAECAASMLEPDASEIPEGHGDASPAYPETARTRDDFRGTNGMADGLIREPDPGCGALPGLLARGLCHQDRRIAHLRYVVGLKQDDIARVTGMTRPAVSKRLSGIRERAARLYRR